MLLVTSNNICACQIKAHNGIKIVLFIMEAINDAIVMSMLLYGASCHAKPQNTHLYLFFSWHSCEDYEFDMLILHDNFIL
jgi:hypothetical protein